MTMSKGFEYNFTFDVEATPELAEFVRKMQEDAKKREMAIQQRISDLFCEYCKIEVNSKEDVEVLNELMTLFSIGYKLGFNDSYLINNKQQEDEK